MGNCTSNCSGRSKRASRVYQHLDSTTNSHDDIPLGGLAGRVHPTLAQIGDAAIEDFERTIRDPEEEEASGTIIAQNALDQATEDVFVFDRDFFRHVFHEVGDDFFDQYPTITGIRATIRHLGDRDHRRLDAQELNVSLAVFWREMYVRYTSDELVRGGVAATILSYIPRGIGRRVTRLEIVNKRWYITDALSHAYSNEQAMHAAARTLRSNIDQIFQALAPRLTHLRILVQLERPRQITSVDGVRRTRIWSTENTINDDELHKAMVVLLQALIWMKAPVSGAEWAQRHLVVGVRYVDRERGQAREIHEDDDAEDAWEGLLAEARVGLTEEDERGLPEREGYD